MPLNPGTRIGPYEILASIGAGGMGEVYGARDNRLNRDVAIKVLPESFAADADRLRRFTLEAQATSALNHPNILVIYDVGTEANLPYIVSELLEGESLRARLKASRLSVAKTVDLARQVAAGLAAAHAKGITHRDIKPENLFLTKDGRLKILDFGLAKVKLSLDTGGATHAETETLATTPGVVVGTVAYMSPEQVRGQDVDHRSDIFSLGAVVYEMLTGQRPFRGATSVETMNAILKDEPPEFVTHGVAFPPGLERIVRHCLEKNPHERFHSAGDLAFALEALSQVSAGTAVRAHPIGKRKAVAIGLSVLAALALLVATAATLAWRSEPVLRPSLRLTITLPADAPLAPAGLMAGANDRPALALSADGARLVYVAQIRDKTQLCLRDMMTAKITPLSGTEGGHSPFFSPDGASIAFFADRKLKRISSNGGAALVLADAPNPWGGVWDSDDAIYFNRYEGEGIYRIPAGGGPAQAVTTEAQFMPGLLGGGHKGLLATSGFGIAYVVVGQPPKFIIDGIGARYIPTGHLVYAVQGKLAAVPFDRSRIEVTGPSVSLIEDLRTAGNGVAQFTLAQDGTLIYASGRPQMVTSFVWVDRQGKTRPLGLPENLYSNFDISPDGSRLALSTGDQRDGETEIWIYDFARRTMSRLTPRVSVGGRSSTNMWPRWTPDGRYVVYSSRYRDVLSQLVWAPADGSGEAVVLWSAKADGPKWLYPMSFSPDASVMTVFGPSANTSYDLYLMRLKDPKSPAKTDPQLFLESSFGESFGQISPDGRWMLYTSDRSGGQQIYVTSYPKPGAIYQVSRNGGKPMWNPRAPEIVYQEWTRTYAVDVTPSPEFRVGEPRLLFDGPYPNIPGFSFDMTPDGQQFLRLEHQDFLKPSTTLTVITNFHDELRRRVPSGSGQK